jgi:hypothetical protein
MASAGKAVVLLGLVRVRDAMALFSLQDAAGLVWNAK